MRWVSGILHTWYSCCSRNGNVKTVFIVVTRLSVDVNRHIILWIWEIFLNSDCCFQTNLVSQKVSQTKKLMRARNWHCPSSALLFLNQKLNGECNLIKKRRIFASLLFYVDPMLHFGWDSLLIWRRVDKGWFPTMWVSGDVHHKLSFVQRSQNPIQAFLGFYVR